jgi:hypothetical protein
MATITKLDTGTLWEQFQRNPVELYTKIADDMKKRGLKEAPTMSRALDYASPPDKGEASAFSRLMREAGIITAQDPEAGYWASPAEDFFKNAATRALYTEFFARNWRKVVFATPAERQGIEAQIRAALLSSDTPVGSWARPYADAAAARWSEQVAPAIPLSGVVRGTVPVTSSVYRKAYLDYDAEKLRLFRVGESAEIPKMTIVLSDQVIQLHKYGRALEISYEAMRELRVNQLAEIIRMQAVQSEVDKVTAAIDFLVSGDGGTDTAAEVFNLTTLDSAAVAGTLTLKGWLAFKLKFANPYMLTTALVQEAVALQMLLLNTGSSNTPLVAVQALSGFGGFSQINPGLRDNVALGWTADAPSLKIVGFDSRFALDHLVQIGSQISEMERFILNQTQVATMTEISGFSVYDKEAAKVLNINA